ncbi:carboxypeptidase regulatory-like domain-containing protein [Jeotgalibacillus malaysiensis]|uniref:carboxypeptidase regulatory-like domain-containing protein n=1 Tax=Jeotgalibacillus malaysiensis TaxID=1508404 RepID=UPI00384F2091
MSRNRKFLAGTVTTALVASAVAPVAAAEEAQFDAQQELFTDVPENNSHFENIYKAVDYGLLSGYPDGTYKPLNALTRSNVVKALGKYVIASKGYESLAEYLADHDLSDVEPFNDVTADSRDAELYNFSLIVKEAGIFQGSNNNLMAGNNITRQQMAQVLVNAFNLDEIETDNEVEVEDLDTAFTSYRDDIQILANLGVTTVSNFRPLDNTSRGHLASFLVTAYELVQDDTTPVLASGISGFITDGDEVVEGAVVAIGDKQAVTDENGYYELLNVAAGEVDVTVAKKGYKTVTLADQVVKEDTVTTVSTDLTGQLIDVSDITISGTVVNGDSGASVDAATVTFEVYDEETNEWVVAGTTETTANGSYSVDQESADLALGTEYNMTVEKEGFKSFEQTITTDSQETANVLSGIELDEIAALDLTVNVTDAAGEDVASAEVAVQDAEGNVVTEGTVTNGSVVLPDLQLLSGDYSVIVNADEDSAISYTEFTVTEGTDQTVDVQLEKGFTISAVIGTEAVSEEFLDGSDVTVELLRGNTVVETVDAAVSVDAITASFARIAPADYTLRVSGDYIVTETFDAFSVDSDAAFEARAEAAGVVEGTVNDVDATVNLLDAEGNTVDSLELTDGTYKFSGVAAGEYTVEVVSEDFVNKSAEVTVEKNADTTADFTLESPASTGDVAGFVRTKGTLAAANVTVVYHNEEGAVVDSTETVNGAYSLTELAPGTYTVVVRGDGFETFSTTQTIEAGDNLERVNYTVETGADATFTVNAVDSKGEEVSLEDAGITLTDSFFDAEDNVFGVWTETAVGSTVEFTSLSAGDYDFTIDFADGSEYVDVEETATIASGEDVALEITVAEKAAMQDVSFRVVDENNADATAKAVVFNEDGSVNTIINSDGELSLVDGNYTIAFFANGYAVETRDFTVSGNALTIPVVQLIKVTN